MEIVNVKKEIKPIQIENASMQDIADAFDIMDRSGSTNDNPEGTRWVAISDTLLRKFTTRIRELSAGSDLISLIEQHTEFAVKTFPDSTAESSMIGLKRECDEVISDIISNAPDEVIAEEYADCEFYMLDSMRRRGITFGMVLKAMRMKLQKNISRNWKQNGDQTYSHT